MDATVRVSNKSTDPIRVESRMHQGCVMAPVLFDLYFTVVLQRYHDLMALPSGIELCVTINCNLFPRPSRRAAAPNDSISDLEYADDAMFCESSREASTLAMTAFDTAARLASSSTSVKPSS